MGSIPIVSTTKSQVDGLLWRSARSSRAINVPLLTFATGTEGTGLGNSAAQSSSFPQARPSVPLDDHLRFRQESTWFQIGQPMIDGLDACR